MGNKFIKDSNRPKWVPVTIMNQGKETLEFKSQFVHWTRSSDVLIYLIELLNNYFICFSNMIE
jgi:hypothetical protein